MPRIGVASYLRPDDEGLGLAVKLVLDDVKIGIHEAPLHFAPRQRSGCLMENSKDFLPG